MCVWEYAVFSKMYHIHYCYDVCDSFLGLYFVPAVHLFQLVGVPLLAGNDVQIAKGKDYWRNKKWHLKSWPGKKKKKIIKTFIHRWASVSKVRLNTWLGWVGLRLDLGWCSVDLTSLHILTKGGESKWLLPTITRKKKPTATDVRQRGLLSDIVRALQCTVSLELSVLVSHDGGATQMNAGIIQESEMDWWPTWSSKACIAFRSQMDRWPTWSSKACLRPKIRGGHSLP